METNPLPEQHLFPRIERVGQFLAHVLRFMPEEAPGYMPDHYRPSPEASADSPETALSR